MNDFDPDDLIWIQDVPKSPELIGPDKRAPAVPTLYNWIKQGKISKLESQGKTWLSKRQIKTMLWGRPDVQPGMSAQA